MTIGCFLPSSSSSSPPSHRILLFCLYSLHDTSHAAVFVSGDRRISSSDYSQRKRDLRNEVRDQGGKCMNHTGKGPSFVHDDINRDRRVSRSAYAYIIPTRRFVKPTLLYFLGKEQGTGILLLLLGCS